MTSLIGFYKKSEADTLAVKIALEIGGAATLGAVESTSCVQFTITAVEGTTTRRIQLACDQGQDKEEWCRALVDHAQQRDTQTKRGWIYKRGQINTKWQRRFFVLESGKLSWYLPKQVRADPSLSGEVFVCVYVCVYVYVYVYVRACLCVRVCVHVCVRAGAGRQQPLWRGKGLGELLWSESRG